MAVVNPEIDVHLENFDGPLDLLMFLIRKNSVDIYDIPIASVTKEYLLYLDKMRELDLDIAGDFLVMAATLTQIKARMLLPQPGPEDGGDSGPDPRAALISMLEEYQRYKEASKDLAFRFDMNKDIFYRSSPVFSGEDIVVRSDLSALIEAFRTAFSKAEGARTINGDLFPIASRILKIKKIMETREGISVSELFASETHKLGVITCFMAVLELVKQGFLSVSQEENLGEISLRRAARRKDEKVPAGDTALFAL